MAEMRARKAGIGAQIDAKLEGKYDEEEAAGTPEAIMLWLNAICEGEHDAIANSSQRKLHECLKDGVMLCKVINKLNAAAGKAKVSFQKKCSNSFVAMGNMEAFNKGCIDYGMEVTSLFQSTDLWEGRKGPFLNVINCLHSLGMLANSLGFEPTYTGQVHKVMDFE